ncbi:MAG: DUF86 domain-containing protein [Cyanophyceae cyanobacterium]
MSRDITDYLNDILENIAIAQEFINGLTFEQFDQDPRTTYAVTRAVEIIGEAAKSIPTSIRNSYPQVPWRSITGMRDKMIHQYFGINHRVLWSTVQDDLPALEPIIRAILIDLTQ